MITREADYALRAIIYLAKNKSKGFCPTIDICEKMLIPYRFLRKISRKLVDSGIAEAQRGKQGGLALAVDPEKYSLLDVLKVFDARSLAVNLCSKEDNSCERKKECEVHEVFLGIQKNLEKEFDAIKIADLAK
ncbi:MAG: Rrf2 family transcriptional regulator [Candidatus Rifleibacteriota bacterium]